MAITAQAQHPARLVGHANARPVFSLACCTGIAGSGSGSAASGSAAAAGIVNGRLSGYAKGRPVFAFGLTCAGTGVGSGSDGSASGGSGSGGGGLRAGNYLARLGGHARSRNVWAVGVCSAGARAVAPDCCPDLVFSGGSASGGASGGSGQLSRVCADIYSVGYGGSGSSGSGPSGYGVSGGELLVRVCLERVSAGEFSGSFVWGGVVYQLRLVCANGNMGAEGWIMLVNGQNAGQAAPGSTCNPFNIIFSVLVIAGIGLANIRITSDDSCCQPGSYGSAYGSGPYSAEPSGGGDSGGDTCLEAEVIASGASYPVYSPGATESWWKFSATAGPWRITVDTTVQTGSTTIWEVYQGSCAVPVQKFTASGYAVGSQCGNGNPGHSFTLVNGDAWVRMFNPDPIAQYAATFVIEPGACP